MPKRPNEFPFQGFLDASFVEALSVTMVTASTSSTLMAPATGKRLIIYRIDAHGPSGGGDNAYSDGAP